MSTPLFPDSHVDRAFAALRRDLLHEDGPRISTMRNYRFAIVQYPPQSEFEVRLEVQRLSKDLADGGWNVTTINLQKLLLDRVRGQGDDWIRRVIAMERETTQKDLDRGLGYLKSKLTPLIEGPDGIAADCGRIIRDYARSDPDKADRTLAIIGRAGGLYPFFRSSALLRHLDGNTDHVPVVLLYPGERQSHNALSFMGVIQSDRDYRPRIYP